jgi:LacI family transcriptional regulator
MTMMKLKQKTVTIVDIARDTGVSPSTVSRVLTGNIPVAPETASLIWEAIERLGYRPNQNARGLVTGASMVIGVLTQDIASSFFGSMLAGIEKGFEDSPYSPIIIPGSWSIEKELNALDILLGKQIDGLIILNGRLSEERIYELEQRLPVIIIGRSVPGIEHFCIKVDSFQGAYDVTWHLIELGHRKIAHIAGPFSQADAVLRRDGYCKALEDAGLNVEQNLILEAEFSPRAGILAMETFFTRGTMFSAIFAGNDQLADGCMLGLYRHGLRVPHDVSLVGFDDDSGSAYTVPPLTTVRQPTFEMGEAAAKGMLALLNHQEPELPLLSTELVIRESTSRLLTS